jgi:hypothetical protein
MHKRITTLLIALVTLAVPAAASAQPLFGVSTETPEVFTTVQHQMPVQIWAPFLAWSHADEFNIVLARARAFHVTPQISWESFDGNSRRADGMAPNDISAGKKDAYIIRQARAVRSFGGRVYLRFDHEMNGTWYPWSKQGGPAYIRMWRHVWTIFRQQRAFNVRWVWSVNLFWPGSTATVFDRRTASFYPGAKYVDFVGVTYTRGLLNGLLTASGMGLRADRLLIYRKPMWVGEAAVDRQEIGWWMPQFRAAIDARPWIKGVIWLTGKNIDGDPARWGDMHWLLSQNSFARHWLTWKPGFRP